MAIIKNSDRKTPIGLPCGTVVPPGEARNVPAWDTFKDRPNVAFYVGSGVLSVEHDQGHDPQGGEADFRQELIKELQGLGIAAHPNSKTETLLTKLAEAKAKAASAPTTTSEGTEAERKAALIAQLEALGVPAGPDATIEELQAALAAKQ
ncbi:hypothetical protein [Metapseudomonas otitidis]|uniref:hypothetical protein n=1 Tax=Metapseudomonas otitidis TaxID=319939 RepID=UPI0013F63B9F|nr:hypothetical protein [Pseudomonas otitidis]